MATLDDFQTEWPALVERAMDAGYADLSADDQIWYNVQCLVQAVHDGGLISYYYNSSADHLADCVRGLRSIGADTMAELIGKVNELFPGGVPTTMDARNEVIGSWPDDGSVDKLLDPLEERAQIETANIESKLVLFLQERRG